jgi:hypothetical protein
MKRVLVLAAAFVLTAVPLRAQTGDNSLSTMEGSTFTAAPHWNQRAITNSIR